MKSMLTLETIGKSRPAGGLIPAAVAVLLAVTAGPASARGGQAAQQPAVRAEGATQRVVVAPFAPPEALRDHSWRRLSTELSGMLSRALVLRGVTTLERERLDALSAEERLALEGVIDARAAAGVGARLSAQCVVIGSITEFGVTTERGVGGVVGGILTGGRVAVHASRVKLAAHLVDVGSGEIIGEARGAGKETTLNATLLGGQLFRWIGGVDFSSDAWRGSKLRKAAQEAVDALADDLCRKVPAAPALAASAADHLPAPAPAVAGADLEALRRLSIVVLIPETHLARPRVPDPAAETEIVRQLLAAGLRVKDDQRLKALRDERWVQELARGTLDRRQLDELRSRYGTDLIIVGEGISERSELERASQEVVVCRGRVEIKAIRLDTAEIIASDAEHAPGRELSEVLASKLALKNAGGSLAPRFIQAIASNLNGRPGQAAGTATVELEVSGLSGLTEANALVMAVARLDGVRKAEIREWRGGILFATVEASAAAAGKLGLCLESDPDLQRFGVAVETSTSAKVSGAVRPVTARR